MNWGLCYKTFSLLTIVHEACCHSLSLPSQSNICVQGLEPTLCAVKVVVSDKNKHASLLHHVQKFDTTKKTILQYASVFVVVAPFNTHCDEVRLAANIRLGWKCVMANTERQTSSINYGNNITF